MSKIVPSIFNKDFERANEHIAESFSMIMAKKLVEMKKMVSAKMFAEMKLDGFKPSYDNIEDRRTGQIVQDANKTSRPGADTSVDVDQEGKGDLQTTIVQKNNLKEEEQLDEARVKIIKARVRGGKVQRRKKVSNVPGMTIRGGKLTRMSPAERRRRKMGARKAKVKRKTKRTQMLMKRKRSMMRRRAMGL